MASEQILSRLTDLARRNRATLVGFDFPYGYPRGFGGALKLSSKEPWKAIWTLIAERIVDNDQNRSNRFEVAADLNARFGGEAFPFWGCPSRRERLCLTAKHTVPHRPEGLPEYRFTEQRTHGPQPAWKLYYHLNPA